jgi:hypothetical protein
VIHSTGRADISRSVFGSAKPLRQGCRRKPHRRSGQGGLADEKTPCPGEFVHGLEPRSDKADHHSEKRPTTERVRISAETIVFVATVAATSHRHSAV